MKRINSQNVANILGWAESGRFSYAYFYFIFAYKNK